MRMPGLRIALLPAFVGATFCLPLAAQEKKPPPQPKPPKAAKPPATKPAGGNNAARPQESPAKELDHFAKMTPEQQSKELAKLPPGRRAQLENRLNQYNKLSPEQQEKFKERLEVMQSLPKDRQNAVKAEIVRLRALPPAERRKAVNGDELAQKFSPDEQRLIRDMFPGMRPKQGRED
jgi:mRNA-degrading endonuclease RelE of RelBE toxin-antitoxin system